jgi:hypothetical protein
MLSQVDPGALRAPAEPTIEVYTLSAVARRVTVSAFLNELEAARNQIGASFAPERLALVARVSEQILKGGVRNRVPGVVHFAYWTRHAALKRLAADHVSRMPPGCIARPRGLVFHLPPQNVETVFLYSWVISYLSGNANLTRLPSDLSDDMAELLDQFQLALAEAGDGSQLFVRYPIADAINAALSARCDARIVWGGDVKVRSFAPLPLRNGGKAIWFGDRRSLSMVKSAAIGQLNAASRRELAERLHNDIFVFNQMACSSPQWLVVIGSEAKDDGASQLLLGDLSDIALERGSAPPTSHVIQKMVTSMARAGQGHAQNVIRYSNALTTITTERATDAPAIGGGFLTIVFAETFEAVYPVMGENIQTITQFGFEPGELRAFSLGLPLLSATRVVPIGQALDFDAIWDGYDLFGELTRLLKIG